MAVTALFIFSLKNPNMFLLSFSLSFTLVGEFYKFSCLPNFPKSLN